MSLHTSPSDRATARRHLQHAHRWSFASVCWTLAASAVAIATGLASKSLLLVAFGAIGALDAIGSAVLVVHFRHAIRHHAISERRERVALMSIAIGMGLVAVATALASGQRLFEGTRPESSALGSAIAAMSVMALAILAVGKKRASALVDSRALVADSHVSTVGAVLALFTVTGVTATSHLDWWWLDPSGSLVVAAVAFGVAASHARAAT